MPPLLQKLSLLAYRGISALTLEDLSPVSLIVGANNSGKSSILEAAGLLLRPPEPAQWINAVRHRDIDMSMVDGVTGMFPDFDIVNDAPESRRGINVAHDAQARRQSSSGQLRRQSNGRGPGMPDEDDDVSDLRAKAPIHLEGTFSHGARTVLARCIATPRLSDEGVEQAVVRVSVSVDGAPEIDLKFPGPATVAHQIPPFRVFTVTPSTHYSTKAMVEHLSHVVRNGDKPLAVSLLQVFDPEVEDLDVSALEGREAVLVTHKTRGVVDLSSFGDGMRRSTALALALTRATQGVLLIDEIETGIHPRVLPAVLGKLLAAAAASSVQLIATTHSLEAIDALITAAEEQHAGENLSAYWIKREQGKHQARRYDFDQLCRLREGGLDIR